MWGFLVFLFTHMMTSPTVQCITLLHTMSLHSCHYIHYIHVITLHSCHYIRIITFMSLHSCTLHSLHHNHVITFMSLHPCHYIYIIALHCIHHTHHQELRCPLMLNAKEKNTARSVVSAFKQNVCGFDLLRTHGTSYVCDVNGWSFVKRSIKVYMCVVCMYVRVCVCKCMCVYVCMYTI